jgi:hypothetical protein
MSALSDSFTPYAHAEKELSDKVGPLLSAIVQEIERRNGIEITELRVTIEKPSPRQMWPGANCVIVR